MYIFLKLNEIMFIIKFLLLFFFLLVLLLLLLLLLLWDTTLPSHFNP